MDIKLQFNSDTLDFDLSVLNNDLEKDLGLQSAVIVSLFSDARVSEDELPPGQEDRAGWWGDAIDLTEQDFTGSKLWLLTREKQVQQTLDRAQQYCLEALAWLTEDGIASSVDVETSYPETERMLIAVEIARPSGNSVKFSFNIIWEGQANAIQ